jgi:hypothetical protein
MGIACSSNTTQATSTWFQKQKIIKKNCGGCDDDDDNDSSITKTQTLKNKNI